MPIEVIWYAEKEHAPTWKNCTAMLIAMLGHYDVRHWAGQDIPLPDSEGAVFVIHGESVTDVDQLNADLQRYKWVVLIYLGDETRLFPLERVRHPDMKIWCQDPLPGRHEFCDRFMLNGWTPKCIYQPVERDLDWFFAGQVVHERREAVVRALNSMPGGGFIIQTKGYTQGIAIQEYWRCLSRAKFVPCPTGFNTPDTARAWESLECGAVPILDRRSFAPRTEGIWEMLLPAGHPLPIINEWEELPGFLYANLPNWQALAQRCQTWWASYKEDFYLWLGEDIQCLQTKLLS